MCFKRLYCFFGCTKCCMTCKYNNKKKYSRYKCIKKNND